MTWTRPDIALKPIVRLDAVAAGLGILAVLGALPPMRSLGIWMQSESVVMLQLVAGTLAFLSLAAAPPRSLPFPAVAALTMCALGLAASPWAASIGLTVFGSPQLGDGVMHWAVIGGMIVLGQRLRQRAEQRLASILAVGGLFLIAISAMLVAWAPPPWRAYDFTDLAAFHAVAFFGLATGWLATDRDTGKIAAIALGGAGLVWLSDNRAAFFALFAAAAVFVGISAIRRHHGPKAARRLATTLAALAPLAVTALVPAVVTMDLEERFGTGIAQTLLSREHLWDTVFRAAIDDPGLLVAGAGWGHFGEFLLSDLSRQDVVLYHLASQQPTGTFYWDATWRLDFHSHNAMVEALAANGLPGLAAQIALFASIPWAASSRRLASASALAVFFGLVSSFWFYMPPHWAAMALALGALASPARNLVRLSNGAGRRVVLFTAGAALAIGVVFTGLEAVVGRGAAEVNVASATKADDASVCAPFAVEDLPRAAFLFSWLLRHQADIALNRPDPLSSPSVTARERLDRYLCRADAILAAAPTIRVAVTASNVSADLVARAPAETGQAHKALTERWATFIDQTLRLAPKRTDLAAPYLLWLFAQGREGEMTTRASRIREMNRDDSVGLWFEGLGMTKSADTRSAGLDLMRRALDTGIDRIIPIDPSIRRALTGS